MPPARAEEGCLALMAAWEHLGKEVQGDEGVRAGSLPQYRPAHQELPCWQDRGPDMGGQKCGGQGDSGRLVSGDD